MPNRISNRGALLLRRVFPGEACDDLGGEFCDPEYQQGVYQEAAAAK